MPSWTPIRCRRKVRRQHVLLEMYYMSQCNKSDRLGTTIIVALPQELPRRPNVPVGADADAQAGLPSVLLKVLRSAT